ncbi:ribonuclease HI [Rhizobium sp. RHZ02]|uniref:ribonuclease H family protein n=1 Tax=Rhizobium sp. RHZ02 TaxID=2769306 RepID=UPI00177DDDCA|nr:ribonuclease H [Rhizobium sp. RHZ02]MBD9455990.1 ribonuclease HI [Rhizobium sp. RHZ02]
MISIYTDGACEPNPGAGGWAFVVYENGVNTQIRFGGDVSSTNNIMEMTAVLAAIEHCIAHRMKFTEVRIFSDSQYVVKGCNEWRHGWARKGWEKGKASLKNAGLWKAIAAAHDAFPCAITWVRGHSGIEGNEEADRLAEVGRKHAIEHRITSLEEFAA